MTSKMIRNALMLIIGGFVLSAPVSANPASVLGCDVTIADPVILNCAPVVKRIQARRAKEGEKFTFKPSLSNYIKDPDPHSKIAEIRIRLQEDSWLTYYPYKNELSGTPEVWNNTAVVRVKAKDEKGAWSNQRRFTVTIDRRERGDEPVLTGTRSTPNEGQDIIAAISGDGRFVAEVFQDTVEEGIEEGISVRDLAASEEKPWKVFRQTGGSQGQFTSNPSISADGRTVAFAEAAGEEEVWVLWIADPNTNPPTIESVHPPFPAKLASNPRVAVVSLAADGRIVAFEDGTNVKVAEVDTDRHQSIPNARGPSLSFDGSRIAYEGVVNNVQHVLVATLDFDGEEIEIGHQIDIGPGSDPVVSTDGRFVAFESDQRLATDDKNDEYDIYVYPVPETSDPDPKVHLASVDIHGDQADGNHGGKDFFNPSLSGDGSLIAFDNFVSLDGTGQGQIFARGLEGGEPRGELRLVSVDNEGDPGFGGSTQPALSANGRFVAFASEATNLTEGVNPGFAVFSAPAFPPHAPAVNFELPPPEPAADPQR